MKKKINNIFLFVLLAVSVVPITNIADDINNQYQEEVVSQQDKLEANSFVVDNDEILDRNQVIKLSKVSNNASDFDPNMVTIQQQSIDEINKLKNGGVVEFKIGYQNQEVVVYAIKTGDNVVYNKNEAIVVNDTKIDKENIDNAKQILSPVYIDLNTNTKSDKVSIKQEEDNLVVGDSTLAIKVKIIDNNLASVNEQNVEKQEDEDKNEVNQEQEIVFNYGYENTNGEFVKIKASENKVNVKNQLITIPSISGYDFVNVYSDNVEYNLNNKEITITSNNSGVINVIYKPIIKIDAYNKLITNEQAQTIKSSDDLISLMNVSCQGIDKSNLVVDLHNKTITEIANNQSGVYPITFSDNKEAKTTVVLTVATPPGAVEASNGNGWVNGNDATIRVSEAKSLAGAQEGGEEFSNLFNFQAYCKKLDQYITPNASTVGAFTVDSNYSDITSGKVGKYEIDLSLTLTVQQGRGSADKIVNLYVFPDDAIISDDQKGFLEGGSNFVVKASDASNYNKDYITQRMQVIAYYDDAYTTPSVDVTNGSIADIRSGIINDYNISFGLTQSSGSKINKVFSVVSDEAVVTSNNLGYIQANDLVISTNEAQTLNSASDLIALMQAKGLYDGVNLDNITPTLDFSNVQSGTPGNYNVTFTSPTNSELTITKTLTVAPEGAVVSSDKLGWINANNVSLTSDDAISQSRQTSTFIKNTLQATGYYNGSDVTSFTTTSDLTGIKAGTVGVYPVTVSMTNGNVTTSKEVTVLVRPNGSEPTSNHAGYVFAQDLTITPEQAQQIADENQLFTQMQASGMDNYVAATPTINTNGALSSIQAGEMGAYPITFSVGDAQITKYVYVKPQNAVTTNPPKESNWFIAYNGGVVTQSQIAGMSEEDLFKRFNSFAVYDNQQFDSNDYQPVAGVQDQYGLILPMPMEELKKQIGVVELSVNYDQDGNTFTQWDVMEYPVKIIIAPDGAVVNDNEDGYIYAQDAVIEKIDAPTSMEELIDIMNSSGVVDYTVLTNDQIEVTSPNGSDILVGKDGVYPVTFSPKNDPSISITVNLTILPQRPDGATDVGNGWVYAHNLMITQDEAKAIASQESLAETTYMDASAMQDNVSVPQSNIIVNVDANDWSNIKAGNVDVYDIKFTLPNQTQSHVAKLTVRPNDSQPTQNNLGYVDGRDKVLKQSEAKAQITSEGSLVTVMEGSAVYNSQESTNISADSSSWDQIRHHEIGEYQVNLTLNEDNNPTISKTLWIVSDKAVISSDQYRFIDASNYVIHATDAKQLANQNELISLMKASTNIEGDITVSVDNWNDVVAGVVNDYQVTFTSGSGSDQLSITVILSVVDDETLITGDHLGYITAKNKVVKSSDAPTVFAGRDFQVTVANQLSLEGYYDGQKLDVNTTNFDINTGNRGQQNQIKTGEYDFDAGYSSYPIKFSIAQDTNVQVVKNVIIVGDDAVISADEQTFVDANNTVITSTQAQALANKQALETTMGAVSVSSPINVSVSDADWNSITAGTINDKVGYDVNFSVGTTGNDDFASKDTKLFVVDDDAVISDDQKGYIDTNTVILKSSEAKQMFANNLEDSIKSVMDTNAIYNGNDVLSEVVVDTNNQDANIQNGVYDETNGYSMYPISYTYEYEILYLGETFTIVNDKKQIIIVDDNADVSVDQNVMVNGNNGRIHKDQATGVTNAEDLKQYIGPVAIIGDSVVDINNINIDVDPTVLATIQSGKVGSYPVTLWIDGDGNTATTDDYASKEVIITVYDDSTVFGTTSAVRGDNFVISKNEVGSLTPEDAVNRANGEGWLLDGTNNNLEVNADISNVKSEVGVYPVELTAGDATTTVYVTVVGPNSNVANNELINAENFTININDVDAADFVNEAQAQAWDTTTGQEINPVTLVTQKPTAVGAYKMTYTTPNGTTTTSITNVIDDQTQVGTTAAVRGENFEITINDAQNLTPQQAVTNADGKGWLLDGTNNNLDVDADISNVKPEVGVYPVELTAGDATTTVNAIVKGPNSVVNDANKEMINAENFTIHIDDVPGADFVAEGQAEAWDTETRDSVTPVTMVGQKPTAVGAYPITYTTQKGTETTIIANVIDDSTVINDNDTVAIRGKNFQITIDEAQTLTPDDAVNRAEGKGWLLDGTNNNLDVDADISNVKPEVGVYPVELTTTDGVNSATTTVYATVVGPNTVVDEDKNEIIDAHNFTIDKSKLSGDGTITLDDLLKGSEVQAWDTTTGQPVNVTLVGEVPQTVGPHEITFITDKGTEITVVVNIIDENCVEGDKSTVTGQNFEIDLENVKNVTDETIITDAKADAWHNDGTTPKPGLDINKDQLASATKPGVYPVEITADDDPTATTTVNAIVKGPNSVVDDTNKEMINAEDFTIHIDNVPGADFVAEGQAEAWDTETRDSVTPVTMVGQKPTAVGAYPITYTTQKGTETTIIANVIDDSTVINDNDTVAIRGENFQITIDEAQTLTPADAVNRAEGKGWLLDGTNNNLDVDADISNVKPEVGVYPVELTTTDGVNSATTTVMATVYDNNTVINGNTLIDANDRTSIPKDTVDKMTDEEFIEAINGVAWDTTTGQKLPVSLKNPKPTEVGTHDVTLVAPDGTEITVQVTILPMMTAMNIAPNIEFIYPTYDKDTNSITVLVQTPITTLEIAKATDHEDGDITDKMTWTITRVKSRQADEALDTSTAPREYLITYKVYDSKGASCTRSVTVYVVPIILPGDDDNMDTEDDILVTPNPDAVTPPTVNPDGSVFLPEGGEITFPDYPGNDDIITIPPGSTIFPDGTIIAPDGSETKPMPDGSIQLPGIDGSVSKDETDNPVFKPEGDTTVNPDGSLTVPDNGGTITFPNNPDNDDITLVPGGSNIASDGTITTPEGGVVRPRPEGGVELTGDDDIVNGPNHIDNPFVKPEGDGPIVVNPDGSVTLPDDEKGNLTYPNSSFDGTITIPAGSTVDNHDNVTTPDGVTIPTNADGSIFMPGQDDSLLPNDRVDDPVVIPSKDATINNDGSVDLKEEGTLVFPNNPDNTNKVTIPAGSHIDPNGDVTTTDGVTIRPNPDGSFELPGQEGTIDQDPSDNPFVTPGKGDSIINPDGSVTVPNVEGSTVTFPNTPENENAILIPGGTNVKPDGLITTPNGGVMMPNADGSIIIPADGSMDTENAIVRPNNGQQVLVDADGNITLPEGGEVEYNNCIVPVAKGGVIGQDSVVRNPGQDGVLFTSDDEILDPRSYCIVKPEATAPNKGQQTPNKGQGTNTGIGVNVIVPIIALLGSLILLIILFIKRRKDKEQ